MNKMTIEPNIFKYATSELSQDAFLCYLLEFGKNKYKNKIEYECAKKFLNKCGIYEDVNKIYTQYKNIDVLVETENYLLIIEDKTYTNEHNDQILHYVKTLQEDDKLNNKNLPKTIVACYMKTADYLHEYKPNINKMKQEDDFKYHSLNRDDMMNFIKDSDDFIFQSFYDYLENFYNCNYNENDLSTWDKSNWFKYLKDLFEKYNIYKNDGKNDYGYCDINNYVPNPAGGFYATHFNWKDLPENMQLHFADNKQTKAGIYNQLELFFNNGKTSRINLSYRFHSDNWKKEETKEYRRQGILSKLQKQIEIKNYKNQNKMGASTAYKIMKIYKDDINEEKNEEIKKAIEEFIKNPS